MSQYSEQRLNWLDQVKADAEAITEKRLLDENPELKESGDARRERFAVQRGEKAAPKAPEPSQPLPGDSDGQPDQGAIEEPSTTKKGKK